jgi:orotate phosphoribosyltransferase
MCAGLEGVELKGFLVRKEPKKHGNRNLIEGKELTKKDRVVVVDDVVTSGGSIIRAINVLSQNKIKVIKAVAVVDREQGARENFKKLGCDFFALFTKSDLFNAYDQKKK